MRLFTKDLLQHLTFILLLCLTAFVFCTLLGKSNNDFGMHIGQIIKINQGESTYPSNFLFYYLVNLISNFSEDRASLNIAVNIVLTSAVLAKFLITKNILKRSNIQWNSNKSYWTVLIVAIGLFFFFSIPDPSVLVTNRMYLGKLVPMVWHNSTTIAVLPFAILLFYKQLQVFQNQNGTDTRSFIHICVLIALNITIKPSFIFVYIPVTAIIIILRYGKTLKALSELKPIFFAVSLILAQYFIIYKLQIGSFQSDPSGVVLTYPFKLISNWTPIWYIPITYSFSMALPIYCIIKFKDIIKFTPFIYSALLLIAGILISAFLMETGPREGHGNFTWQNVICSYLVFLSCLTFITQKYLNDGFNRKRMKILIALFLMHSFSGILYLVKITTDSNYY